VTDQPLGLPRGSVRALMSLTVIGGAGAIAGYLLVTRRQTWRRWSPAAG